VGFPGDRSTSSPSRRTATRCSPSATRWLAARCTSTGVPLRTAAAIRLPSGRASRAAEVKARRAATSRASVSCAPRGRPLARAGRSRGPRPWHVPAHRRGQANGPSSQRAPRLSVGAGRSVEPGPGRPDTAWTASYNSHVLDVAVTRPSGTSMRAWVRGTVSLLVADIATRPIHFRKRDLPKATPPPRGQFTDGRIGPDRMP
jgi:hypothetical protein